MTRQELLSRLAQPKTWDVALHERSTLLRNAPHLAQPLAFVMPSYKMGNAVQGVHVVVDREFLPGAHALMVPRTADGRVLFGVPWLGKVILGTTDTPRGDLAREPRPFPEELDFILGESARYLVRPPRRQDIRSRRRTTARTPSRSAASTRCWPAPAGSSP